MSLLFKKDISTLNALNEVVKDFRPLLKPGVIFFLDGDLGAGKTTFVAAVCKELGLNGGVSSPTYALHHEYQGVLQARPINIQHLDLYRLETEDQIESVGLWDLLAQKNSIFFIEWSNRVDEALWPLDAEIYKLNFNYDLESGARSLTVFKGLA